MSARHYPNIGGELSAAIADAVATSMSSDALAALPAIASPDFIWICIDPDGIAGAPEWAKITAHTAAATTATIERSVSGSLEGSTARAHRVGIEWVHTLAPSELDGSGIAVQTDPPAGPAVGDLWYDTDETNAGDVSTTSVVRAQMAVNQTLAAGFTKLIYGTELEDTNAEYDPTTGLFTAGAAGVYLATVGQFIDITDSGGRYGLALYKNGAHSKWIRDDRVSWSGNWFMHGVGTIRLAAGDTLAVWGYTSVSETFNANADTFLEIVKVAN